ncbi:MAG TPA: DUF2851 family protein [Flavisolibacter sp.]|nr:DUF2851 family protein [Flavisolibacter sp.]
MTEKLLQFIWQFQYFSPVNLSTTANEPVQVVYPGQINHNQGPDFLGARIRVGTTLLAGSVELHLRTSDWQRHQHTIDPNYNNVILHVVYQNDEQDSALPVVELESRISRILLDRYGQLMLMTPTFACAATISQVKELTWKAWKDRLVAERLIRKADRIFALLQQNKYHWEETFWWMLARNFGATVNSDTFEEVARSIPVGILAKHKFQIHPIEALLFGQANLLNGVIQDEYGRLLQREYNFLKAKYKLSPVHAPVHFMRMRPGNFPTIRLAQLASLICSSTHLLSQIIEADACSKIKALLSVTANDYWHYRYRFDEPSEYTPKKLGATMIDTLMINTVIPMLFAYGQYHNQEKFKLKALQWLEETKAEINNITTDFKNASLKNGNAFDSQAYIELRTHYCNPKRCLECAVGNALLRST